MREDIKHHEIVSAVMHAIGALLSVVALVLLVVFASRNAQAIQVVSFSIFGASLILLYTASAVYHFMPHNTRARHIMQRLDHAMIFVLIAGSYTPITLVTLGDGWGWGLFGIIWGIAATGLVIKLAAINIPHGLSVVMYVVMGWIALIAINPLAERLSTMGLVWLFLGGGLYTLGVLFYALDVKIPPRKWAGMHEVFHLFVMAGSISHFFLMLNHVLPV